MNMKKLLIIFIALAVGVFLWKNVNKPSGIKVMGYKGIVTDVVNGNTLILNTGLKVWMLGVEPNRERAEAWIRNNLVGKMVELVSDSGNEQTFSTVGATVKAYVILTSENYKVCANRLLINDNRDCATLAYMKDSSFVVNDDITVEINDKALYMKQRTMVVQTNEGMGTGFFINENGVAITNNHVLDGNSPACVFLYSKDPDDSKIYSSRRRNILNILWTSRELDITIYSVQLETDEKVPYFNLIKKHEPQGKDCHILGNPQGFMASYAKGVISAYRDDDAVQGRKLVQYDLATNGGNSGGPVMNDRGEIIAVHVMGMKTETTGTAAQGLNFGIDILQVRPILESPSVDVDYGGK